MTFPSAPAYYAAETPDSITHDSSAPSHPPQNPESVSTTTTRNGHAQSRIDYYVALLKSIPQCVAHFLALCVAFLKSIPQRIIYFLTRCVAELVSPTPSYRNSCQAILWHQRWIIWALIFLPVGWALHFLKSNDLAIFIFCFATIIPLASLLAFATDDLSKRVGQTMAGLLNATLGNVVELIVGMIALYKCQLHLVQASLIGSMLSNLLLVLGMCFMFGGVKYSQQGFGVGASQLNSSLLTLSVIAMLIPAVLQFATRMNSNVDDLQPGILSLSHGIAIILLITYAFYLIFQLWSHTEVYDEANPEVVASTAYKKRQPIDVETQAHDTDDDDDDAPLMSLSTTIGLLLVVTGLIGFTAEFLVDSINTVTASGILSQEFVGLILLPIPGNAAEHVTAVISARKNKLTLSMGVAVGSSIQIAFFVLPFTVIWGWGVHKPLSLLFDPLEAFALFVSVLTVNYVVADGKSNYLEGVVLFNLFIVLGVVFWFYNGPSAIGGLC